MVWFSWVGWLGGWWVGGTFDTCLVDVSTMCLVLLVLLIGCLGDWLLDALVGMAIATL